MLSCLITPFYAVSSYAASSVKRSGCCRNIELFFGITNTIPIIALGLTKINCGLTKLTGFLLIFYFVFIWWFSGEMSGCSHPAAVRSPVYIVQ